MYRCIPSLVLICVTVFSLYIEKALLSQDLFTRLSIIIFLEITYLREGNLCLLPFSLRLSVLLIFLLRYSMMSLCGLWKALLLFVNVQCDGSEAARSRKMQGFVAVSS